MTKYFHFLDKATGEYFSVADENVNSAKTIARENFSTLFSVACLTKKKSICWEKMSIKTSFPHLDYYYLDYSSLKNARSSF